MPEIVATALAEFIDDASGVMCFVAFIWFASKVVRFFYGQD